MEVLAHLTAGLAAVAQPGTLLVLVIGLVLGLVVAVLPGLTLVMGVVLALPFTYAMGVVPAIVLLTAMYVSGTYGGAFTAILFRIPGEPIDVPLLWDGYPMARSGRPALALGWTLIAALIGGLAAAVAMIALAEPVARVALKLGEAEYLAVVLFGMTSVVCLAGRSIGNGIISLALGLLIASVGRDGTYAVPRFTFGLPVLADGIEYLTVMIGAYGLGEVLTRLERPDAPAAIDTGRDLRTELPTRAAILGVAPSLARSSILGFLVGVVPGAGATVASFLAYGVEAQYGGARARLGQGAPEGIVAPQAAATASVGGAMVPLLTMGIPGSGATAILLGAFMLHGIQPGPQVFFNSPELVYATFAAVLLSLIGMVLIGLVAIRLLVRVLDCPAAIVAAFIAMFCFVGTLATRNNPADLWLLVAFGVLGWLLERWDFPLAPLVLGCILGPLAEASFMTMMISHGNDWTILFTRPISGTIMALAGMALAWPILTILRRSYRSRRARRATSPIV